MMTFAALMWPYAAAFAVFLGVVAAFERRSTC
jgi:hypothetical protein